MHPLTRNISATTREVHRFGFESAGALEAGCDDYDTKPIDFNRLLEKIGKYLA